MSQQDDEVLAKPSSKRRLGYNESHSQSPADPKSAWTASRCLRLLRPLSSKVNMVKRAWNPPLQGLGDNKDDERGDHKEFGNTESILDISFASKNKVRVKYGLKRKRMADNHTGGNASKKRRSTSEKLPGELSLATPFVSKYFGPRQAKPSSPTSQAIDAEEIRAKRRLKWGAAQKNALASVLDPCQNELKGYQQELGKNLYNDLSSLLSATRPKHEQSRGARSLLSACLRKVPTVIREEQAHVDCSKTHERYDVSTAMYNELEERFSMSNSGWKHLRQLVRAHGIEILCDCIRNGLLDLKVVRMLQYACVDGDAISEFHDIFWCLVHSTIPSSSNPRIHSDFFPLGRNDILQSNEHPHYYHQSHLRYQELGYLFKEASLPMEMVASTSVIQHLQLAIEDIAHRGSAEENFADSAMLVENVIHRALNLPASSLSKEVHSLRLEAESPARRQNSSIGRSLKNHNSGGSLDFSMDVWPSLVQNRISSLMTIIIAMDYLRLNSMNAPGSLSREPHVYILPSLSLAIQQYRQLARNSRPQNTSTLSALEASQTLLGHYLLLDHNARSGSGVKIPGITQEVLLETLEEILHSNVDLENLTRALTTFVCLISRFCGRAHRDTGFDYIKCFVSTLTKLEDSSATTSLEAYRFLRTVGVEAAMTFAEQDGWKETFEWACQIQLQIPVQSGSGDSHLVRHASNDQNDDRADELVKMPRAFRWEDAISEWVATTPAKSLHQPFCCELLQDSDPNVEDSTTGDQGTDIQRLSEPCRFRQPNVEFDDLWTERNTVRGGIRKGMLIRRFRSLHHRVREKSGNETNLSGHHDDSSSKRRPLRQIVTNTTGRESLRAQWRPKAGGFSVDDDSDELSLDYNDQIETNNDYDGAAEPDMDLTDIDEPSLASGEDEMDELSQDFEEIQPTEVREWANKWSKLECLVGSSNAQLEAQGDGILDHKLNKGERDALASGDAYLEVDGRWSPKYSDSCSEDELSR